jgi:glutamine amidotransferase
MCRFLIYKGKRAVIADLITRPEHSLIKQSFHAREREEPLNGDGFGVGWYEPEVDRTPGLFTSLTPAWGNRNLHRLAEKVASPCIFAHVRAASKGLGISEANCHPFQYRHLLWMHNGVVRDFDKIKRKLRRSLKDKYYNMIEGTTDSEHAFALFMGFLPEDIDHLTLPQMRDAMVATIKQLKEWTDEAGIEGRLTLNFAVTDGEKIVVTRYATHTDQLPESLYYSYGKRFECKDGVCRMTGVEKSRESIIISSEPLTEEKSDWIAIQPNQLMMIDEQNNVEFQAL